MKKIVATLILAVLPMTLKGQDLIPFQVNNNWGYKDTLENVLIEPQYQWADKYVDKYAIIAQNDSLGAIDKANDLIIEPKYEYLRYIGNENFLFGYRGNYFGEYNLGIITSNNNILLKPEFYSITFTNGYFKVNRQSYNVIDSEGIYNTREIINKYGLIDASGKVILEPIYSDIDILKNGYLKIRRELNGNYALLDEKFRELTDFDYKYIGEFHDGLIQVWKNDCSGYLNVEGEEVLLCEYERPSIFVDGFAIVRKNGHAGLINKNGEIILDFKYQGLGIPYKNQVAVLNNQKWGMIDLRGDTLLNIENDKRISEFKGLTAYQKNDKWQIWDFEEEKLLPQKYDEVNLIEGDETTVLEFGKIKPKEYSQSIAFVRIDTKWGIINSKGELLFPIEYEMNDLYQKLKAL